MLLKIGYPTVVIFVAILFSIPFAVFLLMFADDFYASRRWPFATIPGFGQTTGYVNPAYIEPFWHDHFVKSIPRDKAYLLSVGPGTIASQLGIATSSPGQALPAEEQQKWDVDLILTNPETGTKTESVVTLPTQLYFVRSYGDRLFFVSNPDSFEFVDGEPQPSDYRSPHFDPELNGCFSTNGELALIENTHHPFFFICQFQNGSWNRFAILLPDLDQTWPFGKTHLNFKNATNLSCVQHGNVIHLFLKVDGRLLHHQGLDLQPEATSRIAPGRQAPFVIDPTEMTVSALMPSNDITAIAGWSLVGVAPEDRAASTDSRTRVQEGFLIDGHPAALIVDESRKGYPVGDLYRMNDGIWSQMGSIEFPFGTTEFRTLTTADSQKAYILASSSMGGGTFYCVDGEGIRLTRTDPPNFDQTIAAIRQHVMPPNVGLMMGIPVGLFVWLIMWMFKKPDYEFGIQSVKLASLGRRGLARLIDLALILSTTLGLGWFLTRGFDWLTLQEALNLHLDHPTFQSAVRIGVLLGIWMTFAALSFIVMQGRNGLTPGKWICGLRTLRTTLRPCGFARSLARELMMCVDTCNFLLWTPGIVSIALTKDRQRLGDLIAETVVVQRRSLPSNCPSR